MITLVSRLWYWLKKVTVLLLIIWFGSVIVFKYVPVPFSAVMMERQISAWLNFNFSYVSHSDWVDERHISPYLYLAVIAAEDQNFPHHWGFDLDAIERAYKHNQSKKKTVRGASTISQQTVKNLWLWDGRSWVRKGFETAMTPVMEVLWSKTRILTVYLNIVEFGDGVFGVEEASKKFFNKPASKLSMEEAALLAAVLPNPHRYSVKSPSSYVLKRQAWILNQMHLLGGKNFLKINDVRPD
ncbi:MULTISPECIES: monofunctional biosynthetic peptidoglycan transglycosylase [Providencia]|uniref:Biosynthetic peptidoglycan transglycosylase n=1 Tax=Providencia heimbachae ATCC 35613 TaxID=1354272 RepID=A0A1B7JXT6_9GAMM|nr:MULTISPECIES: monofunctional biosynthetic peptidoglycan transglycosylase [Providencia]MBP6122525.1 monofunctional biosynthetic peptidoglycan transglycosylase [Providencia sp.]MDD9340953.1 monofunctional biosynthetic peptidoglycan transglycosylase [Providencia heimbachae]NIH23846.1 monofunctional biosynthetic peptidoglycan transglycosylase [Providencia heimbachae]OAT52721.1 monofunctional biosynthetic peptidoglycan transglycosylase [Providencia heimbachae ATCC 35613]QCJ71294.1 monofunctional